MEVIPWALFGVAAVAAIILFVQGRRHRTNMLQSDAELLELQALHTKTLARVVELESELTITSDALEALADTDKRYGSVKAVHAAIASPAGMIVSQLFSDMWLAHGLKDIGIQDIVNGRT